MEESIYINALNKLFFENIQKEDNSAFQSKYKGIPYYQRWFGTWEIAELVNQPLSKVRYELSKLEKRGLVESNRRPNYITWSTEYVGFKKHLFADYAERT